MKIKSTLSDRIKNVVSCFLILMVCLYLAVSWGNIPDKIPGHYNFAGTVDRWGDKSELLVQLVVMAALFVLMTVLERFPRFWNTGVEITKENKDRIYGLLKHMITSLKLVIVLVFTYITLYSTKAQPLSVWFLPIAVSLLLGTLAYYIRRMFRAK